MSDMIARAIASKNTASLATNTQQLQNIAINIENFPRQNGETDDTARIGRAVTSLGSNGVLQFAQGKTYTISAYIPLKSKITLDGNGATITNSSSSEIYFFTLYGCKNVVIKNFTFDGNNSTVISNATTSARKPMLYGSGGGMSNISIRNNTFQNGTGGGILLYGVINSVIEDNTFNNMNYNVISTLNSISLVRISGNEITNSYGIGINIVESTTNTSMSTPTMPTSSSGSTGVTNTNSFPVMVYISGGTITGGGGIKINGISQDLTSGNFLLLPNDLIAIQYSVAPTWTWSQCALSEKIIVTDNFIYNMSKSGSDYAMGIQIESSSDPNGSTYGKVRRCIVTNNVIDTMADMGMSISGAIHMVVNNNYIKDITGGYGAGIENVSTKFSTYNGNIIKNCSSEAFIFDKSSDCILSDCIFGDKLRSDYTNQCNAVTVGLTAHRNIISNNLIDGWTYGIYINSGNVKDTVISENRFNYNFIGIESTNTGVGNLSILNNVFTNTNNKCIELGNLSNSKISGNRLNMGGIQFLTVNYPAIHFTTNNTNLLVTDNYIENITTGIQTDSGTSVSNSTFLNNMFVNTTTAIQDVNITGSTFKNNVGYNPKGNQTAPAIPTSGTALTNPFQFPCRVFISGGTITQIAVNGTNTGLTSGQFTLEVGDTINLTYSSAPTWVWLGQ